MIFHYILIWIDDFPLLMTCVFLNILLDMHYNIVLGVDLFFLSNKKMIHCGYGNGTGIPEPIGCGYEIQFLIPVGYG